ncbi:MAG: hypothetical protein H6858_00735 [Rhodospirillales bacterium]|nr:hypothetical protein [Rhodospirillales bacterium]
MGDLFTPSHRPEKDYSLRQLWRTLRGLPTAAMQGVSSMSPLNLRMPDDWDTTTLDYETPHGIRRANVTVIPAKDPLGVVGFMPGWKTSVLDKIEAIEDFRNSGYSVVSIRLVNPGLETGSLADSLQRIKSFGFSDDSPLYNAYSKDLPRFVVTHSTSGMLFQHALIDARYHGQKLPPIAHAFHTAPFFDTSGSSEEFHPLSHWLYKRHARRHFNELAGTPFMDRLYYYFRGISHMLFEEDPSGRPTHGQILEISQYGKSYFARKEQEIISGCSPLTIPQTFVISTDDSFSCPDTAEKAALYERAEVRFCEAQHNPLLAFPVRRWVIDRMKELTVPAELLRSVEDSPFISEADLQHADDGALPLHQFT